MAKVNFMKMLVVFVVIGVFVWPAASNAAVLINEIAWMGTSASASDEWIELYNPSQAEIDLSSWNLYESGGDVLIVALSGKISAGGYYLIERTNDNTIKDIPADLAHSFGGNGLHDTNGEFIILKDAAGSISDSVDASGGWPAGEKTSRSTMERKSDGGWQTNDGITINGHDASDNPIKGTPKSANSAGLSQTESTSTPPTEPATTGSSGSSSSNSSEKILKAEAGPDIFIEKGKPIALNGIESIGADSYKWYLGDGAIKNGAEITYTYQFPGTYLVTLEVSSESKTSTDQLRVFVFGGRAVISEFFMGNSSTTGTASNAAGGWMEIYNPNNEILDMSGWILSAGNKNFIVPAFVIILKGGYLVFSQQTTELDLSAANKISVKYPNGLPADEVVFDENVSGYSANRTQDGFFWSREISPGRPNIVLSSSGNISDLPPAALNKVAIKSNERAKNYVASFYNQVQNQENSGDYQAAAVLSASGFSEKLFGSVIFWISVIIFLSLFISLFYLKFTKNAHNS